MLAHSDTLAVFVLFVYPGIDLLGKDFPMLRPSSWLRQATLLILLLLLGSTMLPSAVGNSVPLPSFPTLALFAADPPSEDAAHLVASTVVGNPVAAGKYLFWIDLRDAQAAIYGYDLDTLQEFLIKALASTSQVKSLASDGVMLV